MASLSTRTTLLIGVKKNKHYEDSLYAPTSGHITHAINAFISNTQLASSQALKSLEDEKALIKIYEKLLDNSQGDAKHRFACVFLLYYVHFRKSIHGNSAFMSGEVSQWDEFVGGSMHHQTLSNPFLYEEKKNKGATSTSPLDAFEGARIKECITALMDPKRWKRLAKHKFDVFSESIWSGSPGNNTLGSYFASNIDAYYYKSRSAMKSWLDVAITKFVFEYPEQRQLSGMHNAPINEEKQAQERLCVILHVIRLVCIAVTKYVVLLGERQSPFYKLVEHLAYDHDAKNNKDRLKIKTTTFQDAQWDTSIGGGIKEALIDSLPPFWISDMAIVIDSIDDYYYYYCVNKDESSKPTYIQTLQFVNMFLLVIRQVAVKKMTTEDDVPMFYYYVSAMIKFFLNLESGAFRYIPKPTSEPEPSVVPLKLDGATKRGYIFEYDEEEILIDKQLPQSYK
jgi:hypothetical protein